MNGPNWRDAAVIVTYDENGGFGDHVAPPSGDQWGPGTRIPAIVFSRFAKGGVDSTSYDTTALLKLIEKRWNLAALGTRDAAQTDMSVHAFNFAPPQEDAAADVDAGFPPEGGGADGALDAADVGEDDASSMQCEVPPVPSGMRAHRPSNRFAYIPPQCFAKG